MRTPKSTLIAFCLFFLVAGMCSAGVTVEDGLTKELMLKPGDKTEGKITLRNNSATPQAVKIYQADYMFYADGRNSYDEPGSVPRSNSSWITTAPARFTIPANDTFQVYFSIQVPKDDSLAGTYWSLLMVEPVAENSLAPVESEHGKVTVGLTTVLRYAVQMVTHIGDGVREIKLSNRQLIRRSDNNYLLQFDIENTGERWSRPMTRAELYDTQGTYIGRFVGERYRTYPGCSVRAGIPLTQLSSGKYSVLVILDDGEESAWGAQYELDIRE